MLTLAERIEARYKRSFLDRFPYKDCYRLQRQFPEQAGRLIPDLDQYFAYIAGYASSATGLGARPKSELRTAIRRLQRCFTDIHPEHEQALNAARRTRTPQLYRHLRVGDALRSDLIKVMRKVVSRLA